MPIEVYVKPVFGDIAASEVLTEVILPGSTATYIELSETGNRALLIVRCSEDDSGAEFFMHSNIGDELVREKAGWYNEEKKIDEIGKDKAKNELTHTLRSVGGTVLRYTFCYTEKLPSH